MKRRTDSRWFLLVALFCVVLVYSIGAAQGKTPPIQIGETNRWQVVTNLSDASKTFLVDTAAGETFIFSSAGDSFLWKRIERAK